MPMEEITMSGDAAQVIRHQIRKFENVLADPEWEWDAMVDAAHDVHESLMHLLVAQDQGNLDHMLGKPASWRYRQALYEKVMAPLWEEEAQQQHAQAQQRLSEEDFDTFADEFFGPGWLEEYEQQEQERRARLQAMTKDDLRQWAADSKPRAAAVEFLTKSPHYAELKELVFLPILQHESFFVTDRPITYLADVGLTTEQYVVGLCAFELAGIESGRGIGSVVAGLDDEHRSLFLEALQLL